MAARRMLLIACSILLGVLSQAPMLRGAQEPMGRGGQPPAASTFFLDVPAHPYDIILARPTRNAITVSILAYQDMDGYLTYGTRSGNDDARTPARAFAKGQPVEIVLNGLRADTRYCYQFHARKAADAPYTASPEYTFHTQRAPGSAFTFTMTADAHLDEHTSPAVYCRTLDNIRAEAPDFHLDLGNLFMTDKHARREEAATQYLAQRYYLGQIGVSVPIMLALGVHDGESSKYVDGTPDCLAVWANLLRKQYFPNPLPGDFYTGNTESAAHCGLPEDYYAWEWGDALFVVLDPYRYSLRQRGDGEGWGWSLGQAQYQWLARTLAQSHAPYKFVFIHNLLCGDQAARGGVEVAGFNEWGGKNADGTDGFAQHRPGWEMPVHALLVRNHVTAVFKAHDNFFARQELDGIVYQMIPQPSFAGDDRIRDLENYGYQRGTFLGNSGHVRVTVADKQVTVEYISTAQPNGATDDPKNGTATCTYAITPAAGRNVK